MAITLDAKTEVAISTNPETIAHPTGTTDGDFLVLIVGTNSASCVPDATATSKWLWWYHFVGTSSNVSTLIAFKRFRTGDTAPSLVTNSTGYAAMYRYSGVKTAYAVMQAPATATTQDSPYVSAEPGMEIIWVGVNRRTATSSATCAFNRGTVETDQTWTAASNYGRLATYREAVATSLSMVQATQSQTGTPTYAGANAVILSDEVGHVYKGRATAADDTTGVA